MEQPARADFLLATHPSSYGHSTTPRFTDLYDSRIETHNTSSWTSENTAECRRLGERHTGRGSEASLAQRPQQRHHHPSLPEHHYEQPPTVEKYDRVLSMSSDGERSPKRQRLESYSPASPPVPETKAFVHQPHTPPPSVRMSPSCQSQHSTFEQKRSGPSSGAILTPPSTAGLNGQQRSFGGEEGAEGGSHTPDRKDGEGDTEMQDTQDDGAGEGDVSMVSADAEHRRTDHERQGDGQDTLADLPPAPRLYKHLSLIHI